MSGLRVTDLHAFYGDFHAVRGVSLEVQENEFVTLLGESGCGKTTVLRCLAGLETPKQGQIEIGGVTVSDAEIGLFVPPNVRRLGMVFQSYALWPYMTALQTVAYPMRLSGVPKAQRRERAARLLDMVGLAGFADRNVGALSGGQQQRVALARALANESRTVLFDEPLSNLDAQLRRSVREEIRRLHEELGTTSIFVTHDHEEALSISDRIVIMQDGRVEQVGRPYEIFNKPVSRFVAEFVGYENLLPVSVVRFDGESSLVRVDGTAATVLTCVGGGVRQGGSAVLAFRASEVSPHLEQVDSAICGTLVRSSFLGERLSMKIDIGGEITVVADVSGDRVAEWVKVPPGQTVYVHVRPEYALVISPQ